MTVDGYPYITSSRKPQHYLYNIPLRSTICAVAFDTTEHRIRGDVGVRSQRMPAAALAYQ
jgi:hypothetical protein